MRLKTFIFTALCLLFCLAAPAQDIKLVSGVVTDKAEKKPVKNVHVYAYNTVAEAKDAVMYLKKVQEAGGFVNIEAVTTETNEEGYYEIHVAASGALVFFAELSEPVMKEVKGRLELNAVIVRGGVLDEAVVIGDGRAAPKFERPVSNGEEVRAGVTFPIVAYQGRDIARMVLQCYFLDAESGDTVVLRHPKVMDGRDYHDTQLRRMAFRKDADPLLSRAEVFEPLTSRPTMVGWRDTVKIPDPSRLYFYNCSIWLEDYTHVYYEIKDTTILRTDRLAVPMRFLQYNLNEYSLDPEEYRKTPRREQRDTKGSLHVTFPVGKAAVDPSDTASMNELQKMRMQLRDVMNQDGATLKQFHVRGTASPEGPYRKNIALAERRMNYVLGQITSELPRKVYDRVYKTFHSDVVSWKVVADTLDRHGLTATAATLRSIASRYPDMDTQWAEIRRHPWYKTDVMPYLPSLRNVNYSSVVEIYRELTPEEILEKYLSDPGYRSGEKRMALYEYWNIFKMLSDRDELMDIYRYAMEESLKGEPWELPANLLASELLRRGQADTTILAPFIDPTWPANKCFYNNGRLQRKINPDPVVANQVAMMLKMKKYERAGQLAMLLPPEKYHDLIMVTKAMVGYWQTEREVSDALIASSPRNAVVMYLALDRVNQAEELWEKLDMDDPVTHYLKAQIICRKYTDFNAMTYDFDDTLLVDASDLAASALCRCFKMDSSFIDTARGDFDIYEKLFEKAMDFYKNGTDPLQ